jgi:prepilin-type processing-associated H-X9-DG protein
MNLRSPPPLKRAFTLIELIALVAVGAVVSATLLPALSNARTRSASVSCAANQKQLALAMALYAGDNVGAMPPTDSWRNGSGIQVPLTGGGYWAGVTPIISRETPIPEAIQRVSAGLTNSPLWPYAANTAIYHCPADARFKLRPGIGWAFGSYSKVNGMAGLAIWTPTQRPFQRIGEIPEPSMSFLFVEESDPRGENIGTWVLNDNPTGWVDPLAVWHDTGANSVYADGHQDYHRWTDSKTIEAARAGDFGLQSFNWSGGNAANPDFRWVWDRYRYEGWKPLPQ